MEIYKTLKNSLKSLEFSKRYASGVALNIINRFTPVPEIGYTVVCYRGTRIFKDEKEHQHIGSIYAYVYLEIRIDKKNVYICPRYVCCSPTYTSRDGEYRQRFIPFIQLLNAKKKYSELWEDAEEHIMSKIAQVFTDDEDELSIPIIGGDDEPIQKGDILLHADIYPADDHKAYSRQIEEWANESRMAVHLLIANWLVDGYNIYNNMEENHINYNYKVMIYDKDDKEFFDKWSDSKNILQFRGCLNSISFLQTDVEVDANLYKIGQKITPLTIQEVLTRDVALGVWKEIILGMLGTNLTINGIAPGFPTYGNWLFIQGSDKNLFDNTAMHEKFNNSEDILKINEMLKKARDLVWRNGEAGSADLDSLAKKINETMRFSASYITITDVSLVCLTEWIGNTIRDIPFLVRMWRQKKLRKRWAEMHMFDEPGVFIKYIFDWVYNFHAMNVRLGALHGDIHLNNITIQKFVSLSHNVEGREEYFCGPNPMSMYVVPGVDAAGKSIEFTDEHIYLFNCYGFNGAMIDYSRAILSDLSILRTVDEDALPDEEFVQKRQEDLLLRLFHKIVPDIVDKHEIKIKALILEKFQLMHKIAMAADPFNMADNIHLLLESEFPNTFKKLRTKRDFMRPFPAPNVRELSVEEEGVLLPEIPAILGRIRDMAREFLIANLLRAINGDAVFKEEVPWVGELIIRGVFEDYSFAGRGQSIDDYSQYTIFDPYDLCSPMEFSAAHPDKFPQKVDVIQSTIKKDSTKELHQEKIKTYLDMLKKKPEVEAKVETMKSRFTLIEKLPIESTWRYERK